MVSFNLVDADVVWTPARVAGDRAGKVRIERRHSGWKRMRGEMWMPAAHGIIPGTQDGSSALMRNPDVQRLALFVLFHSLVVRDGIKVEDAHEAFMQIREYRQTMSPDINGADRG